MADRLADVLAVGIQQVANHRGGQEAVRLQVFGGHRIDGVDGLDQQGAGIDLGVFEQTHGSLATVFGKQHVQAAGDHGMLPGKELHVIPGQGGGPVVGHGYAFLRQPREGIAHMRAGFEDHGGVGMVFLIHTVAIEDPLHEGQGTVVIGFGEGLFQLFGPIIVEGTQLQQPVAAGFHQGMQFIGNGAGLRHQGINGGVFRVATQQRFQGIAATQVDVVAGRVGVLEGIHAFVVPAEQHFLSVGLKVGHMDLDVFSLADAVQPADALFQQVRIQRQVQQHQMVGKLEVPAFGADLGTDQRLGTIHIIGEEGGSPVPLDQVHVLMEHGHVHAQLVVAVGMQIGGGMAVGTDHQHLVFAVFLEELFQPTDPRVQGAPAVVVEQGFRVQMAFPFLVAVILVFLRQR